MPEGIAHPDRKAAKPFGRRAVILLFNSTRILSLLVLVAAVFFWVRSHQVYERVDVPAPPGEWRVWSVDGVCEIDIFADQTAEKWTYRAQGKVPPVVSAYPRSWEFAGMATYYRLFDVDPNISLPGLDAWIGDRAIVHAFGSSLSHTTVIAVHYWLIVLLASLLPLTWLPPLARSIRRARRRRRGLCPSCGYDLRAGHTDCPECGKAVTH